MHSTGPGVSAAGVRSGARKSLSEVVFDRLVRSIKSGAYGENERLPTEHELAAEFQVSRPVVREALQKLREQGLVYSRRGAGTFVKQLGMREPLGFGSLESISDLERCYEFRLTLEPAAAALAAERHTETGLAGIERALREMKSATDRNRHREDADFDFHAAIARASENQYFATAMTGLKEHIAVGMQFHGMSLKMAPGGLADVFAEHEQIFAAIRDRQADLARDRMFRHLTGSRDRLFAGRRNSLQSGG